MTNSIAPFSNLCVMILQGRKTKYEIQLIMLKALVNDEITQSEVDFLIQSLETYKQK
jgi:hypothetical protein